MPEKRVSPRVFVHIVTYNSAHSIVKCVESVLSSADFEPGRDLSVVVTDNCSQDGTGDLLAREFGERIVLKCLSDNIGFSGGHNRGAKLFLDSGDDFFLVLNPDLFLCPDALRAMCQGAALSERVGAVTPCLLRADQNLEPLNPAVVDAAGMRLTYSLRHFDRGSGEDGVSAYRKKGYVFGGTGACLFLTRRCVEDAVIPDLFYPGVESIYPQLLSAREERVQLFNESFFAYREDAELAWRLQLKGWRCLYEPTAVGYHVRVVTPERRDELPERYNRWSVRNRFLLQLNCFSFRSCWRAVIEGAVLRNLLVAAGVLLKERSSLPAFREIALLFKGALLRRRFIFSQARISHREFGQWFHKELEEIG